MTANLLDGRALSQKMKVGLAQEVQDFQTKHGYAPTLAVLLVGEDPASQSYAKAITKACSDAGIGCNQIILPASTTGEQLKARLRELNKDPQTSGVIVQMPLPKPLTQDMVTDIISPEKDVDGICPTNAGLLALGQEGFVPNTPMGGLELLKGYGIELVGKKAVIVGRSNIVGKPMALLLLQEHSTVTICHTRTQDLPGVTRKADILVAAIGKAGAVTGDMIKPGAVVVDFGINPGEKGIVGDVDFEAAKEVASWITPVPGGTGPMTNVMLMRNTLRAARKLAQR
ncbi:MAG: bifunctional 5,10-methylenetetrahydrofolate dehydrogenase/5,10-methenyltetrahydrofolate cyclohydrolase [Dehalococcoidia bacterium]|nr:bifunctional 5,10-methylenetetrahydrofolate dehydrogenase/5,10-methenyltetrahydrofolate cyclohydrolase [Dehalococcoidia bacterium]